MWYVLEKKIKGLSQSPLTGLIFPLPMILIYFSVIWIKFSNKKSALSKDYIKGRFEN